METATLGARLHRTRLHLEMTREALASILGESPQNVRSWELGHWEPREEKHGKIKRWLAKHETGAERRGRA